MTGGYGPPTTGRSEVRRGWWHELARPTSRDRVDHHPLRLPRRAHSVTATGVGRDRFRMGPRSGRRGHRCPDHHGSVVDSAPAAQAHLDCHAGGPARRRGRGDVGGADRRGGRASVPGRDDRIRARGGSAQRRVGPARLGVARGARRSTRSRARGSQVARRAGHRIAAGHDSRPAGHVAVDRPRRQRCHGRTRGEPLAGGCAAGGDGAADRPHRGRRGRPAGAGPALPPPGDSCGLAGAGGGVCRVVRVPVGPVGARRRAGARAAAGDGRPDGVRRRLPGWLGGRRGRRPIRTPFARQRRRLGGRRVRVVDDGRLPLPVRDRCGRRGHGTGGAGRECRHIGPRHPIDVRSGAPFRVDCAGHGRGRGLGVGQPPGRSADRHVWRPGGDRWCRSDGSAHRVAGGRSFLGTSAPVGLTRPAGPASW